MRQFQKEKVQLRVSGYPIDKELTEFLYVAFKDENDKLKAARYLSTFLKDEDSFLVTEPLSGKIETWGKFAAAIIPVVITVIQFLLGKS